MKSKILALSSVGLAVAACLFVLPVSTRAQEQKAQGYLMIDYAVKPSMAKEFESATIEENGLLAGINFPYGWTGYSTDDFHYYFFAPIGNNFASLDNLNTATSEAETQLGENYKTLEIRMEATYEYYRETVVYLRPDLSNLPAMQNIKPEESNYVFFELTRILPGKEKEFEAYCKEWASLCQKIGFQIGYATYKGVLGTDMPFYLFATSTKTQADTFVEEERIMKILSQAEKEELGAAYEKAFLFFQRYETKHGRSRPDLSYTPGGKKPVK
jgi:hypothetical protein